MTVHPQQMTLRDFYIRIIDDLIRAISETKPFPQANWLPESGPSLIGSLLCLRDRVLQVSGTTDLTAADNMTLRLITFHNLLTIEILTELEGLKEELRQRGS